MTLQTRDIVHLNMSRDTMASGAQGSMRLHDDEHDAAAAAAAAAADDDNDGPDDDDTSSSESGDEEGCSISLGYASPLPPERLHLLRSKFFPSKIGGKPAWIQGHVTLCT